MARETEGEQEWRRSMGQADVPLPDDGQVDTPQAWRQSLSNVAPTTRFYELMRPLDPTAGEDASDEPAAPTPFEERYVKDAKLGVAAARASYRRLMRIFWTLRFGVIGSGLLVAVLSAAGAPVWVVASFGALAAALETVIVSTNLQNRATARGLYADAVAYELRTFSLKIKPYAGDDAVEVLHAKLEPLRASASATLFKLDQAAGDSGPKANG